MRVTDPVQTALVTGCAGFIASRVTELLLQHGCTVVGVDTLNDAYDPRLKEWRLGQLERLPGFRFHRLDVTDGDGLRQLFQLRVEGFDAVLHLAARAGVRQSMEDPSAYYKTNVEGTLHLLELCRHYDVPKFVLSSTSSVYGEAPRPFREDTPTDRPLSPYAASKKAAEALCYTYHKLYGLDMTVFRYFTVYGPAGRPDMSIFRFIKWIAEGEPLLIFGDGKQERDFTYVEDTALGTVLGLTLRGFHTINLGSDRPTSLAQVIEELERLLGKRAEREYRPMNPADVPGTWADISVARKLLGWEPTTTLSTGLARCVEWYLANRIWAMHCVGAGARV